MNSAFARLRFLGLFLVLAPFETAVAVEHMDPLTCFCLSEQAFLYRDPLKNSLIVGSLKLGMPAIAMARYNEWTGVYLQGGNKAWILSKDIAAWAGFRARYPHIVADSTAGEALLNEARQSPGGKRLFAPPKNEEFFVTTGGETEEIFIRKDNVRIYSKPMKSSRIRRETFKAEAFKVNTMIRGWYRVEYGKGQFGWLEDDAASPDPIEVSISLNHDAGSPKDSFCFVGREPRTETDIIARARRDLVYEILAEKNGWYQIRLGRDRTGWTPVKDMKIVRKAMPREAPAQDPLPSQAAPARPVPPAPPTPSAPASAPATAQKAPAPSPPSSDTVAPPVVSPPTAPAPAPAKEAPSGSPDSAKVRPDFSKSRVAELETMIVQLKKDSARINDTIVLLRQRKLREFDSIRVLQSDRVKSRRDSVTGERARHAQPASGNDTSSDLHRKKGALLSEIADLRGAAGSYRNRSAQLTVGAAFEFESDTSSHVKDSLLGLAAMKDSLAALKEAEIRKLAAGTGEPSGRGADRNLLRLDSLDKAIAGQQTADALSLSLRQSSLEQELSLTRTRLSADINNRLRAARQEYKTQLDLLKSMQQRGGKAR